MGLKAGVRNREAAPGEWWLLLGHGRDITPGAWQGCHHWGMAGTSSPGHGRDVAPGASATAGLRHPGDSLAYQLRQSQVGARLPSSPCPAPFPWAGGHRGHMPNKPGRTQHRTKTRRCVCVDGSSRLLRGKSIWGAAAPKSLAGPLHPPPIAPPGTSPAPQPPPPSLPAHPSRWASFFSRSWMTSSSTRMVCWLVSSTPSRDCSWDCRSPCSPRPRGPSP